MKIKFNYTIVFALLFINACNQKTIFEKREIFANNSWENNKAIEFNFEIPKENKKYDLIIPITNTKEFEKTSLNLLFNLISNGEERFFYKSIPIKNEQNAFIGKKIGNNFETLFYYMKSMKFKRKGKYTLSLKITMPQVVTIGIAEIGLIVKESK